MIGLLLFLLIIILGLWALYLIYKINFGITHQPVSKAAIEALANVIEDTGLEEGRIIELGSGFGGFVLGLARRLPFWDVVGIENSPTPWILSNLRTIGKRLPNYRVYLDDPNTWPLKGYDIIFVNHDGPTLKRWEASLAKRMQPENILICLNTRLPRIAPANTLTIDSQTTFYIYQKRIQAAAPAPSPVPSETIVTEPPSAEVPPTQAPPAVQDELGLDLPAIEQSAQTSL